MNRSLKTPPGTTRVLIAGGGPAGLVVAIELGRRGVPCVLLEEDLGPPDFPKANATTSRTMEHFRRLGFADEIRALGLPEDYPQDITYFTRYNGHELARLPGPTRGEAIRARADAQARWPTPEPLHRTQQMLIEPVLKRQAERWPAAEVCFGWRLADFGRDEHGVTARCESADGKVTQRIRADYLVGCDGARSLVREKLGIAYQGWSGEERDFLGGRMLAVYFRCRDFHARIGAPPSWQYWAVNRDGRGLLCAIDGHEQFVFHAQLPRAEAPSEAFGRAALARSSGCTLPIDLISTTPWTAGFTLVAERFADPAGRVLLAGDAAHLFTPTGGQGYNTSVDDAVNLAWKLAAVCQGWAAPALLRTYELERQPIAERNTRFARAMADSIGRIAIPEALEADSAAGAAARAGIGTRLLDHAQREFDIPGIHFGVWYGGSPIVSDDGSPAPEDRWDHYAPHATPGARAPHCWLEDDIAIHDRLGRDFTLLRLGPVEHDVRPLQAAAASLGIPLAVVAIGDDTARTLYGADLVLIRPDQHVAWRANRVPEDSMEVLARSVGWP